MPASRVPGAILDEIWASTGTTADPTAQMLHSLGKNLKISGP